ncbi:hypothetical protein OIU77_000189 [Salix suchowensis]|uniref:Uncharacterized protein n=1 Tax=Salix suchowensis TaxID=1278906 RepID=A0ABQ9B7K2_9ROSI|nr:hypothetical protein OIU77_000189 [Salix suchowensis]
MYLTAAKKCQERQYTILHGCMLLPCLSLLGCRYIYQESISKLNSQDSRKAC